MRTRFAPLYLLAVAWLSVGMIGCVGQRGQDQKTAATSSASQETAVVIEPADNSYCLVCHINYQEEPLAQQHALAGVGCERCHGLSAQHSADEDNLTAPDVMFSAVRVNPFCLKCHPKEKIIQITEHTPVFTLTPTPPPRCTDCHGEHRLAHRTRRWDKDTGKLIWREGGPVMDR